MPNLKRAFIDSFSPGEPIAITDRRGVPRLLNYASPAREELPDSFNPFIRFKWPLVALLLIGLIQLLWEALAVIFFLTGESNLDNRVAFVLVGSVPSFCAIAFGLHAFGFNPRQTAWPRIVGGIAAALGLLWFATNCYIAFS